MLIQKPSYHQKTIKDFDQFFGLDSFTFSKYDIDTNYIIIDFHDDKSERKLLDIYNGLLSDIKENVGNTILLNKKVRLVMYD